MYLLGSKGGCLTLASGLFITPRQHLQVQSRPTCLAMSNTAAQTRPCLQVILSIAISDTPADLMCAWQLEQLLHFGSV